MEFTKQDFIRWLDRNKNTFTGRTLDEIGALAITCGFDRVEVAQWVSRERVIRNWKKEIQS